MPGYSRRVKLWQEQLLFQSRFFPLAHFALTAALLVVVPHIFVVAPSCLRPSGLPYSLILHFRATVF